MEENYLIGLVVIFVVWFLFFKKKSAVSIENSIESIIQPTVDTSVSGVERYLNKQCPTSTNLSGVARYLQEKQDSEIVVDTENTTLSGVAKYLVGKESVPVSSVSKYVARQAIHAKQTAKNNASGVEKYLNNRG